jgi:ACS family hexuronate transporter-like MFS transporter
MSTFGSILGGWLPMFFIQKGWPVFKARKTSMLIYAFCVIPIIFAQLAGSANMWFAVIIIGIATSAHQAWSANIFTTVSDMFPKSATASVTGIGGMFGSLGGILLSAFVQKDLFVHYRSIGKIEVAYYIMFAVCGVAYLTAWMVMHFLVPRMKRVE